MGSISAPEPLAPHHDVTKFRSGILSLDTWLQRAARRNEARGGSRTYVACDDTRVVGFYSLAASGVERRRVASAISRNMPQPVPVILLGQLAVDLNFQGRGLGSDLLVDAAKRALAAAGVIGARAIIVQAYDEQAKSFYERFGFRQFSDLEPLMMVLRMAELRALIQQ